MAKKPQNSGKKWTDADVVNLRKFAKEKKSTFVIAKKLGRTEAAVRSKAKDVNISLNPPN